MARARNNTPRRSRVKAEPAPTTPDPIEIAMEAEAAASPTARTESPAVQLLVNQNVLVREQIALTRHEWIRSHLGLVRDAAVIAGAALLAGSALFWVWNANRADGLVIKAFSVPPALAERGITGEMAASGMMDRLAEISDVARPAERQRRVSRQGADSISIEVAQTGLSLSQADQWLRQKLQIVPAT